MSNQENITNESQSDADLFNSLLSDELSSREESSDESVNDESDEESSDESVNDESDEEVSSDDEDAVSDDADESDADESDADEDIEEKKPQAKERVIRKLVESENKVRKLSAENKELINKLNELTSKNKSFSSTGDIVDDMKSQFAVELGVDENDSRITDRLREAAMDILAELAGETIDDPGLRKRREERNLNKRHRATQKEIQAMKEEMAEKERNIQQQNAVNALNQHLVSSKAQDNFPYLFAAENDVPSVIFESIKVLESNGHSINSDAEAIDAINYVCKKLDEYHEKAAEKLIFIKNSRISKQQHNIKSNDSGKKRVSDQKDDSSRSKKEKQSNTITAPTTGDRKAPNSSNSFEDLLKEELAARKRAARKNR